MWQSNLVECRLSDEGPVGKGSVFQETWRVIGRRLDAAAEVIEYDQPTRIAFRGMNAPVDFEEHYILEPAQGGTRVRYEGEATLRGFFGKLPDRIARELYMRDVRSNLEKLKVLVESEATDG